MSDAGDSRLEREAKLATWPGFALPDVDRVIPSVSAGARAEVPLDATYWDTADLRLIRWKVTLRYRTESGAGVWTVKLPNKSKDPQVLARPEHDFQGPPNEIPTAALDLVRAYARTAQLVPVARLQTHRHSAPLFGPRGEKVAEIADDEVSVLDGERVAARFREVEVEVTSEAPESLLPALIERLRSAGAGEPDPTPKLVRALGPRSLAPPELLVPTVGPDSPVGDVAKAAITSAVIRVLQHDAIVRLDSGPEGVHQARVGTRRLRSDLRTFKSIFDEDWVDSLRDDLKGLAAALGEVRDTDVLLQRLTRAAAALDPGDRKAAESVVARLSRQRAVKRAALTEVYRSPEYIVQLDRLVEAARAPRFNDAASEPAAQALPAMVQKPWNHLVKAVDALEEGADDQLHEIRIRAKRVRYASEAATLALPDAEPMAEAAADVQEVLGEQHDAVVAASWLRDTAATNVSRAEALACGLLIAAEQHDAATWASKWPDAWDVLSKRKVRKWLK